jgi:hypothetical protein
MVNWWAVDHLNVDLLLAEWRWLCAQKMALVAKNVFGDLFLTDESGAVLELDVAVGKLSKVSESVAEFRDLAARPDKQEEWFAKKDERALAAWGLMPNSLQCIGFSTPLVFAESGAGNKPYLVDIYEHLSFLGDLNRQIAELPDGANVRLVVRNLGVDQAVAIRLRKCETGSCEVAK